MLVQTKIVALEAVRLLWADIAEAFEAGVSGVCRAVIQPHVAEKILDECNGKNRPERRWHTNFLSNQILTDRFVFNGETICFCDDGTLGDGQHRLRACVESDLPIDVLVVFGIQARAFTTFDQGTRRIGADVLSIDGEVNCHRLAGALRQIDNYHHESLGAIDGYGNAKKLQDNAYSLELIAKYPGARESVAYVKRIGRLTRPSLAAAMHYLFSQRDHEDANQFLDVVMDGVQVGAKYSPDIAAAAEKLRSRLIDNAMTTRKMPATVVAGLWCKAWNAGRNGRIPRLLSYRRDEGHIEIE